MGKLLIHIVPAIGLGFVIQIIFHEIGHLLGGLLTGWSFMYLQLYRLVILIDNKRLKIRIVGERGYRCIMYPKSINQGAILYTTGGVIANLLLTIAGIIILIVIALPMVIWLYIWSFAVFGLGLFLINGIKRTIRVCNDKECYNLLKANEVNKHCHNAQLIIAKQLIEGISYRDIGEEVICLCPDIVQNDIQAYQAVLEYYYYLDANNHIKMGYALNKIHDKDNISNEVLSIIKLEHIYLQLILSINVLNRSHSNASISDIKRNINKQRNRVDVHSLRVKTVYEAYILLCDGKDNEAIEALDAAIRSIQSLVCIYDGERIFCINQLRSIEKTIRRR